MAMNLVKLAVWMIVVIHSFHFGAGETLRCFKDGCSSYTFHAKSPSLTWEESRKLCKKTGLGDLVSIESVKEWIFLKNTILKLTIADQYFIGLRKDGRSGQWRWLSNNSTSQKDLPWASYQPSGDGNCTTMYKDYLGDAGKYNDLRCTTQVKSGYICEFPVDGCNQEEATSHTERANKESGTNPTMRQSTSSKYFLTESNSEAIPPKDVKDVPIEDTTKTNTKVIVIVLTLLALLILITLIVVYVMYVRRRNFKKQVQSRIRCTYNKPSSPGQQSVEHRQHLESSATELKLHVTLSRSKRCLDTYETIGDQEGPTYANVKQINRKCETQREESLTHEDGTAEQTKSEDGHCMPLQSSPLDATNKLQDHGVADVKTAEKQENKDHVYAIVHKDTKCRDSAASVHARTLCSKRLEPASPACSAVKPVDHSSTSDPADHSDARPCSVELVNNSQEALVEDEKKDYLYAVVDKKKRPPQKPSPFRGLVYADLNHATTSNTEPVKREFPTVYADIDYATTDKACSKLPEEHLHQKTECTE